MARRTQTMVQLNDELLALLDRRASRTGVSRSQLVREAVEVYLATDRDAAIDQQIVDGYTRMPQGGKFDVDEWGDVGRLTVGLTNDSLRALSDEEREAGYEPW